MPRATVTETDVERFDLKSCPGGYVELKRLTYGQLLQRREMVSKMKVSSSSHSNAFEGEIAGANRIVSEFEFKVCIMDHNLTDENDQPLNFQSPMTLSLLDPRIGEEIGMYIDKMNQFEAELPNSENGSVESSKAEESQTTRSVESST